ncbi:universal stress protein [Oceanihabitans sp. 2_MG-2023]|uniref:universal stress protein n=1 Tax=Oceanihabitans sp. 2_MG-2023 TaxID=3062661 RepID=UPI0026E16BF0|nr:universal stress protein [Oceanihabitans sp. 2_MG-2023]MDO6596129.1 universal stress protein [Oceanihabitans sp. 2_MG-2023]
MKRILLPTDFSNNAWNAIQYALHLFKNETCFFYILNTYTPVIYQMEYMQVSNAQFSVFDAAKESSLKGLATIKTRINEKFSNPKHTIETISAFNNLIPEIKEIVNRENIDLVVMGTQGASNVQGVLFGSNTVHVFKSIRVPVLAIPSNFEFEPLHEILFPTDYEVAFQDKQMLPLVAMASAYTSRVNVLHVNYGESLSEKQQINKQKLELYFKHVAHLFHDVKNNNVEDAINEFQRKARINFLVMINNKHSFFENLFFKSTINQIGFHLNIPFLVIPSKL